MADQPALPAELTICTAAEAQALLLGWLHAPVQDGADATVLALDASAVEEVDACGVQLLLSLDRSLARAQRRLLLERASAALGAACQALGAQQLLGPADASGALA